MSEVYVRRLSRIQREYDATRDAADYVLHNWHKQDIFRDIQKTNEEDLRRAAGNLDAIFLIRLFSFSSGCSAALRAS
jgi:hypothetical protein